MIMHLTDVLEYIWQIWQIGKGEPEGRSEGHLMGGDFEQKTLIPWAVLREREIRSRKSGK